LFFPFKQCLGGSNIVFWLQTLFFPGHTLFEAKKQCLKPSNNVFWAQTLFKASGGWKKRAPGVLAGARRGNFSAA
jgi:hypothetical protein